MFGIGATELIVILLIALIVLGPKEIPKVARTIGKGMRELQRAKDELKESIQFDEDTFKEIDTELKKTNKDLKEIDKDKSS